MSIYESLSKSQHKLKKRLFDQHIKTWGQDMYAMRIHYSEDIFRNLSDIEVLSKEVIPVIVRFPDEIPVDRLRADSEQVESTRVFFFDLLPIEVYTRFEDKIENKDILFFFIQDDENNKIPFCLQITEKFAKISSSGIEWMKAYASKYNGSFTKPVLEDLTDYYQENLKGDELIMQVESGKQLLREKRINQILE